VADKPPEETGRMEDVLEQTPEMHFEPPPEVALEAPDASSGKSITALAARLGLVVERLRQQEATVTRIAPAVERIDASLADLSRRSAHTLEELSADLARVGSVLETTRTEAEARFGAIESRLDELDGRITQALRDIREQVAGNLDSFDLKLGDRLAEARQEATDHLATFEERVAGLVKQFAGEAIPEHMANTVTDLSARFAHAEETLAATKASVEFLRSELGGLTLLIKKLTPGAADPTAR
jgi:chromosome segregation ATPase